MKRSKPSPQVLGRAFVLGYLLLLVWFGGYMLPYNFVCEIQSKMYGLTQHECELSHLGGMGLFKMALLTFFLTPWAAIRLVLRKRRLRDT